MIGSSVHRDEEERCVHCYGSGWILDPTEDDELRTFSCHMCLGTGRKMSEEEREDAIEAHYSGLERIWE